MLESLEEDNSLEMINSVRNKAAPVLSQVIIKDSGKTGLNGEALKSFAKKYFTPCSTTSLAGN